MPIFTFTVEIPTEVEVEVEAHSADAAEGLLECTSLTVRGGRGEDSMLSVESDHERVAIVNVDWGLYNLSDGSISLER